MVNIARPFFCLRIRKSVDFYQRRVVLEVLGDLTEEALEGKLANQQVGGLLVVTDVILLVGIGDVGLLVFNNARFIHSLAERG